MPTAVSVSTSTDVPHGSITDVKPAFETGVYPDLFSSYLGKTDDEIQSKIDTAWNQLFYGEDASERVYYPVEPDMAYILDTGNEDVRSEGMSYGMMIAVQLNKKEEFDRLWKWARTYMYQNSGGYKGYFAWHCTPDGTQLSANPASDGEEWFIMSLLFADARWGSGEGIYNYRAEAQSIMDVALHADELAGDLSTNLFDPETKLVVFVPQLGQNSQFTDPSYHLPHFYQLWSLWADKDNDFWAEAAKASREYLETAVNPQTGLAPNYSYFDGKPYDDEYNGNFRYDAFRVGANVGVDYAWFGPGKWHVEQSNRLLDFFTSQGINDYKAEYTLEGQPEVMHRSSGLIATNAVAALAADPEIGKPFVQALWDQELPTGKYRYYDGLLMMLGLLQVSGNFRIYEPGTVPEGQVLPTPKPDITAKFAPGRGHSLLQVGMGKDSVDAYFDTTVTAPGGVAVDLSLDSRGMDELDYLVDKYPNSALTVRLDLKDMPNGIRDGEFDNKIEILLERLSSYNRPVFLHLGYGFNDPANKYPPDLYTVAWKTVYERIKAKGIQNIALVWEAASLCGATSIAEWYPGDEYVDWIGAGYGSCAVEMAQFARERSKPVMIDAVPGKHEGWKEWFKSLFQFVDENNDVVRGVIYSNDRNGPIVSNNDVLKLWKDETKRPFWWRASPSLFDDMKFTQ